MREGVGYRDAHASKKYPRKTLGVVNSVIGEFGSLHCLTDKQWSNGEQLSIHHTNKQLPAAI